MPIKVIEDDGLNGILSATGMNFGKLLKTVSLLPFHLRKLFAVLIEPLARTLRMRLFLDPVVSLGKA